jgi:DNA repair protein RecN (Recombination protein N)
VLEHIKIEHLGIIESAELDFVQGLNVITGESGSGKSMLLDSIALITGDCSERIKSSSGANSGKTVQNGANSGRITAIFNEISSTTQEILPEQLQFDAKNENELIIVRTIDAQTKRLRNNISGQIVPLKMLTEVGQTLIVIHGQQDHILFKDPKKIRQIIDSYANNGEIIETYKMLVKQYNSLQTQYNDTRSQYDEIQKNRDYYKFAISQIDKVAPQIGEDVQIDERVAQLQNVAKIGSSIENVLKMLGGEHNSAHNNVQDGEDVGAQELLNRAVNELGQIDQYNADYLQAKDDLKAVSAQLEQVVNQLSSHFTGLDYTPGELEHLLARQADLRELTKSWGATITDVLEFREVTGKLFEGPDFEQKLQEVQDSMEKVYESIEQVANQISQARQVAAAQFSDQVTDLLVKLGFKSAKFLIQVTPTDEFGVWGQDKFELLFSPSNSVTPAPLVQVASGGELSRIMLAIEIVTLRKVHFAGQLLIFDEVDAGIGGEIANVVADLLVEVASEHQVVVVTHLANIAARANRHFVVDKPHEVVTISEVSGKNRVDEIARMLSGSTSEVAKQHAQELLK